MRGDRAELENRALATFAAHSGPGTDWPEVHRVYRVERCHLSVSARSPGDQRLERVYTSMCEPMMTVRSRGRPK
ncbi:hypothetical protein ACWDZ8_13635, partial [Streptomyces sp. NPDC003233]